MRTPLSKLLKQIPWSWLFVVMFWVSGSSYADENPVDRSPGFQPLETSTNRPLRKPQDLVLTIGQTEGDLQGQDDKIIQAGIDYLHRLGGGTLRILPGVYHLRNAIYLHPNITICGSGENTVLKKSGSIVTSLVRDSDWYEYGVQVADSTGFIPGGGMILQSQVGNEELHVLLTTIVDIQGNVIFLDQRTQKDYWLSGHATASTIFPILTAENVDNVGVKDMVLDGSLNENEYLNGNYTGAVFIQYCNRWNFDHVIARNYNGDGFSFQVCDDIHFQNCKSMDNAGLGFHPGSGSQHPIFRNCEAQGNSQGFFFCWGVTYGLVEGCITSYNKKYGISIGHRDTDNVIQNSTIERNGEVGILFRKEPTEFQSGHRNRIENCIIRDNGTDTPGIGIDIQWKTRDITITNSRIENTLDKRQQTGIRISRDAEQIQLQGNTILNCPVATLDMRDGKEKQ